MPELRQPAIPPRLKRTLELVFHVEGVVAARVWQWTENIEKYYQVESNPVPRPPFDFARD